MSDKPRRTWFQIHLSTAVVLMLSAGVILFCNMTAESVEYGWTREQSLFIPGGDQAFEIRRWTTFGWPLSALIIVENTPDYGTYSGKKIVRVPASRVMDISINPPEPSEWIELINSKHDPGERMARGTTHYYRRTWDKQNVPFDTMIALLLLGARARMRSFYSPSRSPRAMSDNGAATRALTS